MITNFASNGDIKMLIEESQIRSSQMKNILCKKGIFSLVQNSSDLANEIYPIFLGCGDIIKIQELIQSKRNYQKSSIMTIQPSESNMTLDEFQDFIADELNRYKSNEQKYKLNNIHKSDDGKLHMKLVYTKKVKGKIDLLKERIKEIDLTIEKRNDEEKLVIDVRQSDIADLKEVDFFISDISNSKGSSPLFCVGYITLDKLNKENKIKFFDELIAYKHREWHLKDIPGIDVKKSDVADENEQEEALSSEELAGIKSAALKGDSLRENAIVHKFLNENFFFTSIRFKYDLGFSMESFIIDINFKGTDNIKIDIVKTYELDENSRECISVLSASQQNKILLAFQNIAYEIYNRVIFIFSNPRKAKGFLGNKKDFTPTNANQ